MGAALSTLTGCASNPISPVVGSKDKSMGEMPVLRRASLERVDESPSNPNLEFSVEMIEPTVTTEHTARIRVQMKNVDDEPISVSTTYREVFPAMISMGDQPQLALVRPDSPDGYEKVSETCWRPTTSLVRFDGVKETTLSPDERESVVLELWDSPENTGDCMRPGTYRFVSSYETDRADYPFEWGFSIRLADTEKGE